ncbi:hypothetical protein [Kitasatospora sp. NPDC057936]|uniref:hypothetical protein n=1 Tax=Kitasatospora sp. NPDC057936 TaxID=3346283 RepID=UPI0036DA230E
MASLTSRSCRMSAGAWVAEAEGDERRRRAAACRLGRLTGKRAPRWSGEIGKQEWLAVLAAGAAVLSETGTTPRVAVEQEAAKCTKCGTRLNRANRGTECNPCQAAAEQEQEQAPVKKPGKPELNREHLAAAARGFTQATRTKRAGVVDRTRNGRVEALVNELLAARPAGGLDLVGEDERALVEAWSPWRNGPRWSGTRRALSGPRRGGDQSLAQH